MLNEMLFRGDTVHGAVRPACLAFLLSWHMKLTPSMKTILRSLIHVEPFEHLMVETGMHTGALRADLALLISNGFVEVYTLDQTRSFAPFFDVDAMETFSYKATHKGLKSIQNETI